MIVALVNNNVVTASPITITDPSVDGGAAYQALAQINQLVVDITDLSPQPQTGWTLHGGQLVTNGVNTTRITKLAFRERFTPTELIGIIAASQLQNTEGYILQILLGNQIVATYVDLSRSDTIAGLQELVSFSLLSTDRMAQILTTPPVASEIYMGN